jgi:hypothetical protein
VPASTSFNPRGDAATLLPLNPLTNAAPHTLKLSTNLADLAGQRPVGAVEFSFTTTPAAAPASARAASSSSGCGTMRPGGESGITSSRRL